MRANGDSVPLCATIDALLVKTRSLRFAELVVVRVGSLIS